MEYDYSSLNLKIKEKFKTHKDFAKALNLSERSLSLKLNNKTDFKQQEIKMMCGLLDINEILISHYFFKYKI